MVQLLSLRKLAVLLFAVSAGAAPAASGNAPTATIDSGVIVGVQTNLANSSNLVNQYLGVPFAASPTRFSPPQTATPWSSPLQATQRGPACIQVRLPNCSCSLYTIINKSLAIQLSCGFAKF